MFTCRQHQPAGAAIKHAGNPWATFIDNNRKLLFLCKPLSPPNNYITDLISNIAIVLLSVRLPSKAQLVSSLSVLFNTLRIVLSILTE